MLPDLKYASSHEWAKAQGETATVGISDHAQVCSSNHNMKSVLEDLAYVLNSLLQGELGDVVYVELPEVGSTVTKGETFGVVESVKVRYSRWFKQCWTKQQRAVLAVQSCSSSSVAAAGAVVAV